MNNIIYDDEVITPKNNIHTYYRKFTNELNGRDCVKFSLFCTKIVNPNTKESNHCIELVEKWLLNKNSISTNELEKAAYDAAYGGWKKNSVANNSDWTAYYVVNASYAAWTACYVANAYPAANTSYATNAANTSYATYSASYAVANSVSNACYSVSYAIANAFYIEDMILYLKTLLRTTKQYNTKIHSNQHYESILKEIIKEDIDKLTDADYNMLIDLSQEYYSINPNIANKRIFVELLRREYI